MVVGGADHPAFETIVASGPNGAIPHHAPTGRELERGDLVTMDFGALHDGYHADMTRTVAIGTVTGWQREVYDLVALAQEVGIAVLEDGVEAGTVDAVAREVIEAAGHAAHFQHGLGHGVGLEIHEAPMLGFGRTGKLTDRVPVTVEPGVYLPEMGGVRIEDVLVVTAGDRARFLTSTTRELLVL
jgi:Xaa-Pro aminopeptidase